LTYFRKIDEISAISFSNLLGERIIIRKAASQVYSSLENIKKLLFNDFKLTALLKISLAK